MLSKNKGVRIPAFWSYASKPVTHIPMLDNRTGESRLVRLREPMPRILLAYSNGPAFFAAHWRVTQTNGVYTISCQPPITIDDPIQPTRYEPAEVWVKQESMDKAEVLVWLRNRLGASRGKLALWALENGGSL